MFSARIERLAEGVERSTPISKRLAPTVKPQQTVADNAKRTSGLNPQQTELATRIRLGEFGRRSVLRRINRAMRGGNLVVKPVFDSLLASGDLMRKGRGFALVAHQGEGRDRDFDDTSAQRKGAKTRSLHHFKIIYNKIIWLQPYMLSPGVKKPAQRPVWGGGCLVETAISK
ncbi:hypothetical protein [uncultured Microbulbifer sp.]|uniref:hypothetical protein n=1 Tax=uncultured Microbulbifer sp. TaxID=348147 RepID=UPI00260A4A49|nr:hypothetical protein [uncultured Microbulbifer sp.]